MAKTLEREAGPERGEGGLAPTLAVMATMLAVCAALIGAAHMATRGLVGEDVFLKNYRYPFWEESMLYHKLEYVTRSHEPNDVLFLGDSSCLTNLDPIRFQEVSGLSAYNAGILGYIEIDGHLQVLRDYLRAHPRPRLIIYTILPGELTASHHPNEGFKERFIWSYGPEMRAERGWTRWPLDFRLREELRTFVGLLSGGRKRYFKTNVVPGMNHDQVGELLARTKGYYGMDLHRAKRVDVETLVVGAEQGKALHELADFARQEKLPLVMRLAPLTPQPRPAEQTPLARWFDAFQAEYPEIDVEKPLLVFYPYDRFSDPSHLRPSGVKDFSERLAALAAAKVGR